jgi:DNA-binding GntR family transcriptional regulator
MARLRNADIQDIPSLLTIKVRAQSLTDSIIARLEDAIVSGILIPGSRLSEQALARSLEVSRGPLREAIRRLEGRKLLSYTPNFGVRVAALSAQDIAEILKIQEVLQGFACALAARNMSGGELAALKKLLDAYRKSGNTSDDYDDADLEFHTRIIEASGNQKLIQCLLEDVNYLLRVHRARSITTRALARKVLADHKGIVAALERRDPIAAEERMRAHIRNARDILDAVREDPGPQPPSESIREIRRRHSGRRIGLSVSQPGESEH